MRIKDFEWDEGNIPHLQLHHGIVPEEAEEVFANDPLFRRTRKGHHAVFGKALSGRLLVLVMEWKPKRVVRIITGWDMDAAERRYYKKEKGG